MCMYKVPHQLALKQIFLEILHFPTQFSSENSAGFDDSCIFSCFLPILAGNLIKLPKESMSSFRNTYSLRDFRTYTFITGFPKIPHIFFSKIS